MQSQFSAPRVTAIGTCRLHSPLKRAADAFGFEMSMGRIYGYVHTTAEALQQLRHVLGEGSPPQHLAPLISGRTYYSKSGEVWKGADVTFLELPSRKTISLGDTHLQLNRLQQALAESPVLLSILMRLGRKDQILERLELLEAEQTFHEQNLDHRELLTRTIIELQSLDEMTQGLMALRHSLPGRLLVVTHCNAKGNRENPITDRCKTVSMVEEACRSLEVSCYNPTALMESFGQVNALEHGGSDVNHYTPEFEVALAADLHRLHIAV